MKSLYRFNYSNNVLSNFNTVDDSNNPIFQRFYSFKFNSFLHKNKTLLKKIKRGVSSNVKDISNKRNLSHSFYNLLINSWVKKGLKLNFLKHYNIFIEKLIYLLVFDPKIFSSTENFVFVNDLIKFKKNQYDLKILLNEPLKDLEFMFDMKVKKLGKKLKKKYKKKFIFEIKYIYTKKRLKYSLNQLYYHSFSYKDRKYSDRIYSTFFNVIFNTKSCDIWEKKVNTYVMAVKRFKTY